MIYEPGTSDIFTTEERPLPVEPLVGKIVTDEQVLAGLARRILRNPSGCALETTYTHGIGEATVYLNVPRTRLRLTSREQQLVYGLAAGRALWLEAPT